MIGPGTTFGNYTIESILGEGGVGMVYKATHTPDNRTVALKMLNEDLRTSAVYRQQLVNEAQLTASIDSPYVVKVWETAEVDDQPYIAMEYIPGEDLRTGASTWDFERQVTLGLQVAEGIHTAHTVGLMHRDLKPENIKLTVDGLPKILDFGLAKEIDPDQVDELGNIEGTLYYAAPEQLCGEQLSPRCDQFSYGVILYEMFCGRRPFEGAFTASIIYDILHEEPELPTEVKEDLPEWVNILLTRLLAKRPEDRFESMAEVVGFIRECLEKGVPAGVTYEKPHRTVTVIDLKNLSGDEEWSYFCEGFTDDVIRDISRRTDLVVSAEPATTYKRNIKETFEKCRSDYVVVGSLMKLKEKVRLNLSIYGDEGDNVIWSDNFLDQTDNLFDLLSQASNEISVKLVEVSQSDLVGVAEEFHPDVSAYDFYLKGKSYYQTNKPEDLRFAEQMYRNALEIDPNFALAHAGLSDVYAFQYMAYYERTPEKIAHAVAEADLAIKLNPKLPEGYRSKARCCMFTGQFKQAEQLLLKTVDINPKYAIGYRTLAWLKHSQGQLESATTWARKALQLAPTDLETLLLLGLLALNQRQFSVAISVLQRAIDLGPDYGRAYYYLGLVYLKLGVPSQALTNLNLSCRHQGDPNCLIEAGNIYLAQREFENASQKYERSIEAGYFPFVAEYYLGLLERMRGNNDTSRAHFTRAIELTKDHDIALDENTQVAIFRAMSLAGLEKKEEAHRLLNEVRSRGQLIPEAKYNMARCYALLGEPERAWRILDEIMQDDAGPTDKEVALDPHFFGEGI